METIALVIFFIGWPFVITVDAIAEKFVSGKDVRAKHVQFNFMVWFFGTILLALNVIGRL